MNNPVFKVLVCALLCGTSVQAIFDTTLKDSDKVTESDYGCFRLSITSDKGKKKEQTKLNIKSDFETQAKNKTWIDFKNNITNLIKVEEKEKEKLDPLKKLNKLTPIQKFQYIEHVDKIKILTLMESEAPKYMAKGYAGRICGF